MIESKIKLGKTRKIEKYPIGRELIINSNSVGIVNGENYSIEYFDKTIEVLIGIGKDNTASLIMSVDAWESFKNGENIHIDEV